MLNEDVVTAPCILLSLVIRLLLINTKSIYQAPDKEEVTDEPPQNAA